MEIRLIDLWSLKAVSVVNQANCSAVEQPQLSKIDYHAHQTHNSASHNAVSILDFLSDLLANNLPLARDIF